MSDSKCLARAALRTDLHLACVDGPDVGLVLAPGTVGRAGDVPLSCASIAREHAEFSTRGGRACLRASPHTSPIRVRTRMRGWHRLRGRKRLAPGRGFSLPADQCWQVLAELPRLTTYGYPVLIGASRKRFVKALGGNIDTDSAAIAAHAVRSGAWAVRVHDVAATAATIA